MAPTTAIMAVEAIEQAAAERVGHDGLSTIHPTPRTFRIACRPSFFGWHESRNSIALLSTSSFQP